MACVRALCWCVAASACALASAASPLRAACRSATTCVASTRQIPRVQGVGLGLRPPAAARPPALLPRVRYLGFRVLNLLQSRLPQHGHLRSIYALGTAAAVMPAKMPAAHYL